MLTMLKVYIWVCIKYTHNYICIFSCSFVGALITWSTCQLQQFNEIHAERTASDIPIIPHRGLFLSFLFTWSVVCSFSDSKRIYLPVRESSFQKLYFLIIFNSILEMWNDNWVLPGAVPQLGTFHISMVNIVYSYRIENRIWSARFIDYIGNYAFEGWTVTTRAQSSKLSKILLSSLHDF